MKENAISQAVGPVLAPPRGRKLSPCRILVVEPNSDLRLLYTDALASPVCQVDLAEDGAAAWEALQSHRYNLLFTENDLPNLIGDELIRKLRAARIQLPVVMTAARLARHEPARNASLQFAATLRKPFALEALRDTLTNVLRTAAPTRKNPPWRNLRPNPARTTPVIPFAPYENASQTQVVDFR